MKPYVKPEMFYESFELSENIATCAWDMNQVDKNSCSAEGDTDLGFGGVTIFDAAPKCLITDYQNYCYQDGTDSFNIFNS